jgi:hypothetical protein
MMRKQFIYRAPLLLAAISASCARVDTKSEVDVRPIEVKPIHITIDVNVRIDRQLDEFFAFQDETPATTRTTTTATTNPTTPESGNTP